MREIQNTTVVSICIVMFRIGLGVGGLITVMIHQAFHSRIVGSLRDSALI